MKREPCQTHEVGVKVAEEGKGWWKDGACTGGAILGKRQQGQGAGCTKQEVTEGCRQSSRVPGV